jgi:hypothetical protein
VFRVNRLKVWIFTLLVSATGAAALLLHARALRDDAVAGLDARLAAGAGQATAALRASLREVAAAATVAAREPALRTALAPAAEPSPLPRRQRGNAPPAVDPGKEGAAFQAAAQAALASAERALGGELPAGRLVMAANLPSLS